MALIGQLRRSQLAVFQLSGLRLRFFLARWTMRHEGTMAPKQIQGEPIKAVEYFIPEGCSENLTPP